MKMTKLFMVLALLGAGNAYGTNGEGKPESQQQGPKQELKQEGAPGQSDQSIEQKLAIARQLALELPQTLVIRRDQLGKMGVFHSQKKLTAGSLVASGTRFDESFNTRPMSVNMMDVTTFHRRPGIWNFYWNYPYGRPTYNYYNPYYRFRYNYAYYPYYNYSDPYGNSYWYYGWRW